MDDTTVTPELKIIERVIEIVNSARSTTMTQLPSDMVRKGDVVRHILDAFPGSKAALYGP